MLELRSIGTIFSHGIIGLSPNHLEKKEAIEKILKTENKLLSIPIVNPASFVGLEFEVEMFPSLVSIMGVKLSKEFSLFWNTEIDESLRNGIEFISNPIRGDEYKAALILLEGIFEKAKNGGDPQFTNGRTSVHVHVDVRSLTIQQLVSFSLLYSIFEKALAKFLETDTTVLKNKEINRYYNTYCSPICGSNLVSKLVEKCNRVIKYKYAENKVAGFVMNWPKYSSMNLTPVVHQGTFEFRMCHGTSNIAHVMRWVNFLQYLKLYSLKIDPEEVIDTIKQIHTVSSYEYFIDQVFKKQAHLLYNLEDCGKLIMEDIEEIRYNLIEPNKENDVIEFESSYKKSLCASGDFKSQVSIFKDSEDSLEPKYIEDDWEDDEESQED